jgi:glycerophosphoryl diester phosphodiesterase
MDVAIKTVFDDASDVQQIRTLIHSHNIHEKLVLHRGWHSDDGTRPLENTRLAYQKAADTGAGFAECDVWFTKDGVLVLSHDSNFKRLAADETDRRATEPISELLWEEVCSLELKDGSCPVMLSTVLQDLAGTSTKLAVELKLSSPAKPLAEFLKSNSQLVDAIGFVMSFSFNAIEDFHANMASASCVPRILWLVDHPSTPYLDQDKNEGETTFDYDKQRLGAFLKSKDLLARFASVGCGLYMQYNPVLTLAHLSETRAELHAIHGDENNADANTEGVFLGVWSDASLDPAFDQLVQFQQWGPSVDAMNTDMPVSFWG